MIDLEARDVRVGGRCSQSKGVISRTKYDHLGAAGLDCFPAELVDERLAGSDMENEARIEGLFDLCQDPSQKPVLSREEENPRLTDDRARDRAAPTNGVRGDEPDMRRV